MDTQRKQLLDLLASFGITPNVSESDPRQGENLNVVALNAKEGGVEGYTSFVCEFVFNPDGSFHSVGVWE